MIGLWWLPLGPCASPLSSSLLSIGCLTLLSGLNVIQLEQKCYEVLGVLEMGGLGTIIMVCMCSDWITCCLCLQINNQVVCKVINRKWKGHLGKGLLEQLPHMSPTSSQIDTCHLDLILIAFDSFKICKSIGFLLIYCTSEEAKHSGSNQNRLVYLSVDWSH